MYLDEGFRGLLEVSDETDSCGSMAYLYKDLMRKHGFSGLKNNLSKQEYTIGLRNTDTGEVGVVNFPKYVEYEFMKGKELLQTTIDSLENYGLSFNSSAVYAEEEDLGNLDQIERFLSRNVERGRDQPKVFTKNGSSSAIITPRGFGVSDHGFETDRRNPMTLNIHVSDQTIDSILNFYSESFEKISKKDRGEKLESFIEIVGDEEAVFHRLKSDEKAEYRIKIPVSDENLVLPEEPENAEISIGRVSETGDGDTLMEIVAEYPVLREEETLPEVNRYVSEIYDSCGKEF